MIFQSVILLLIVAASRHKEVRQAALIFFVLQFSYVLTIKGMAWDQYFLALAVINTIVVITTAAKYFLFALLSFIMIIGSFFGYILAYYRLPLVAYDTLSITITILQVLALYARVLTANGNIRGTRGRALVRLVNFDCFKQDRVLHINKEQSP